MKKKEDLKELDNKFKEYTFSDLKDIHDIEYISHKYKYINDNLTKILYTREYDFIANGEENFIVIYKWSGVIKNIQFFINGSEAIKIEEKQRDLADSYKGTIVNLQAQGITEGSKVKLKVVFDLEDPKYVSTYMLWNTYYDSHHYYRARVGFRVMFPSTSNKIPQHISWETIKLSTLKFLASDKFQTCGKTEKKDFKPIQEGNINYQYFDFEVPEIARVSREIRINWLLS